MVLVHFVLSGLLIPTLPLPNLHVSIQVEIAGKRVKKKNYINFLNIFPFTFLPPVLKPKTPKIETINPL
ncbi:unnamed protein product, partial [Vitis vinifera]|uniref:Uncharacterized protein n=1 Tax=Vitis vinifera TaxID=29760 RepID=D7TSV0_VITVI